MNRFCIWLPLFAFVISILLINSGELAMHLLFVNPLLFIPAFLIDDVSTEIYRVYNEYLSGISVTATTILYFAIGLLLDNKLKTKNKM